MCFSEDCFWGFNHENGLRAGIREEVEETARGVCRRGFPDVANLREVYMDRGCGHSDFGGQGDEHD